MIHDVGGPGDNIEGRKGCAVSNKRGFWPQLMNNFGATIRTRHLVAALPHCASVVKSTLSARFGSFSLHLDYQLPGGLSSLQITVGLDDLRQRVDMLDPEF